MTTIRVLTTWDPPQRATFAGPDTYYGYHPTEAHAARSVGIGPNGSSALVSELVTIEQATPEAEPHGSYVLVTNGALAGLYVPTAGLSLPPDPDAKLRIAALAAFGRIKAAVSDLDPVL